MTRDIAFELIHRVEKDDSYANLLLPVLLDRSKLDSRDASFTQELAFGTIRNKLLYERIIEKSSGRKLKDIDLETRIVLLIGAHQLLSMRVSDYAAINETVNLAKVRCNKQAVGFVNAVLRKINERNLERWVLVLTESMDESEAVALKNSHPIWIANALKLALSSRNLSETFTQLLEVHQQAPKVSLVALPGLCEVSALRSVDSARNSSPIGAEIEGNPVLIPQVKDGLARVQDQGSQLVTIALSDVDLEIEDSEWLDMCAGPGGKAALLAARANQSGIKLQCNEILDHRAKLVTQALSRFQNVSISARDSREIADIGKKYTRVLLDAPCSGLGALRRRPEARWRKTPADLKELISLQRQLLESAWKVLEPGGVLAYVTCSPHLSETTAQISWFESKFKGEFELLNSNTLLNQLSPGLHLDEGYRTTQLWPHLHNTDAMFLALIRKSLD